MIQVHIVVYFNNNSFIQHCKQVSNIQFQYNHRNVQRHSFSVHVCRRHAIANKLFVSVCNLNTIFSRSEQPLNCNFKRWHDFFTSSNVSLHLSLKLNSLYAHLVNIKSFGPSNVTPFYIS
jgi:hypothetical protein